VEEFIEIYYATVFVCFVISIIIGAVLLKKCLQRRAVTSNVKSMMAIRRQEYATANGLNLYELNSLQNRRLYQVIHI
jgi:hypothetical protein